MKAKKIVLSTGCKIFVHVWNVYPLISYLSSFAFCLFGSAPSAACAAPFLEPAELQIHQMFDSRLLLDTIVALSQVPKEYARPKVRNTRENGNNESGKATSRLNKNARWRGERKDQIKHLNRSI